MNRFFCLMTFCFVTTLGYAQDPIFVNASEMGNGIGFERFGESFLLTPAHVVESSVGDIVLSNKRKTNFKASLLETYSNDIAILRLQQSKTGFTQLKLPKFFDEAITNASSGFVAYLDALGIINYVHVTITSKDQSSFTVIPKSETDTFKKGMSGSPFYVMYNGVKTLVGMLMSIEEDAVNGFVYQLDDIVTSIASFLEDKTKNVIKLGVLIEADQSEHLSIANRIISNLNKKEGYTIVNPLIEQKFVDQNFNAIRLGTYRDKVPFALQNEVDALLVGYISVIYDTNSRDMDIVYVNFEGGLYSSTDTSVIKAISLNTKGLNYNKNSSKESAIKSMLTKINNQFNEN